MVQGTGRQRSRVRSWCQTVSGLENGHRLLYIRSMGHVFDFQDAKGWLNWNERPAVARALQVQTRLMMEMLAPRRMDSVLGIGCGTGGHLTSLVEAGCDVTGIDPSPYMLDIARERFGKRVELRRGTAEALPFEDNAFHHTVFFLSLEYVEDPSRALAEAFRVTRDQVFIGVWNRYSLHRWWRRAAHFFDPSPLDRARPYNLWQIQRHVCELLGDVPVAWRSTGQFSLYPGGALQWFEGLGPIQYSPFGAFLAVVVTLVPRFRVRPLELTCPPKHRPVAG